MFFTQDDYKKIQQWLVKNSVKDTEFNEANIPFNGEETIAIVQGNQNKKVFLKDLIAQVFNLGISDFVNITDKYDAPNISLEEAIRLIPSRARKEGQVITFLDRENHWHIYQFKGALNQWNVLDTWEDLFDWEKLIIDSILPDEEDLTKSSADENGNSYLSLKDREYKPEDFSGLGRIILRKNIVEIEDPIYGKVKKNILTQDMINKSNTIYEIRYDFDLNGGEITIPENCVLDFQGGSFNNGTIVGNNTSIKALLVKIFNADISLSGKWNTSESYAEWFGGGIDKTDNSLFIQLCLNNFNRVNLLKGTYNTKYPIYVKGEDSIIGKGRDSVIKKTSSDTGSLDGNFSSIGINAVIIIGEKGYASNIEIRDVSFYAKNYDVDYGIYINNINNSRFFNIIIFQCKYGLYCDGEANSLWAVTFDNIISNCNSLRHGTGNTEYGYEDSCAFLLRATGATTCNFRRCWGKDTSTAYSFRGVVKSTMIDCGADNISNTAYSFTGCEFSLVGCGMENTIISEQYSGIISAIQSSITFINFNTYLIKIWEQLQQYATYINVGYGSKLVFINCNLVEPSGNTGLTLYPIRPAQGSIVKCVLCNLPSATLSVFLGLSENSRLIVDNGTGIHVRKTNITTYIDYSSIKKGNTSYRPTDVESSYQYFDTTLNKPIWWTGEKWVDATGADV